ncbi:response regulator [Flavobacterium luteum]|uniref:Response regulator transcription factor n=1 Tax=Flavobacterium luteum TaxID=2026654 RepID=A0A7J5A811_9FLAO|nr:response regulator transcription factor [Flavobacterium luteum]KAB1153712.1 response regulator transcription factor [Flavobacterium luteum]
MFNKVIVAEDLDSINIAVVQALKELEIANIHYVKYCDEAFINIKKAKIENQPFELLIVDLYFKADHRENRLHSGEELIAAARKEQPEIKIIVFSSEDKSFKIKFLFETLAIDGFVIKGRNSIPELKKAIQSVYDAKDKYISPELAFIYRNKKLLEIDSYDIELLKELSKGLTQDEISLCFKNASITPNGNSSIEKRINKLKIFFKAKNNVHLIAIAKDMGLV